MSPHRVCCDTDGRILDFEVPSTGSALVNAWGPVSLTRVTLQKDAAPVGKAIMFAEDRGALLLEQVQVLHLLPFTL